MRAKRARFECDYGCCRPNGLKYCDWWLRNGSCTDLCNRKHSVPPHMAHFSRDWWQKPQDPRIDEEGNASQRPSKKDCDFGCCKVDKTAYCHYWLQNSQTGCRFGSGCYKAHCVPPGFEEHPAEHWAKKKRVCRQFARGRQPSVPAVIPASSSQPSVPAVISLLEEGSQGSQWPENEPGAEPEPKPIAREKYQEVSYMRAEEMDEIIGASLAAKWRRSGKLASRPCPVTGSTEEYDKE